MFKSCWTDDVTIIFIFNKDILMIETLETRQGAKGALGIYAFLTWEVSHGDDSTSARPDDSFVTLTL